MKKLLRMICLTLALCMLAGCGAGEAQPTPSGAFRQTGETVEPATAQELAAGQLAAADYPDYPQRPGMEDYTDSQGSMDMDAYDAAMSAYQETLAKLGKLSAKPDIPAVRDFAADTSLRLLAGETENAVYSPVSLYLTLAMLADLSGGDTSQQVRQLLNLQDPEALRQQVQQLWMALYCDNGITTCRLAGSAWVAQGSTVHQAAPDSLQESTGAACIRQPWAPRRQTGQLLPGWTSRPAACSREIPAPSGPVPWSCCGCTAPCTSRTAGSRSSQRRIRIPRSSDRPPAAR